MVTKSKKQKSRPKLKLANFKLTDAEHHAINARRQEFGYRTLSEWLREAGQFYSPAYIKASRVAKRR